MKIEIELSDVTRIELRAMKNPMGKTRYSIWVYQHWEDNGHIVFKTENYQEALCSYQHLLGEMQS